MPLPHSHILHAVLTQIQAQLPAAQRGLLTRFVEHQYQSISEDELMEQGVMALQGAILSQWHLLQVRKPQAINCRVYNPTLERNGWHSPHTVIELCQQDRPFLVDSLTVKLERLGIGVHFIVHSGCLAVERDLNGQLVQVLEGENRSDLKGPAESVIFVEIDHQADHNHALQRLQQEILTVMHDVSLATDDYQPMLAALEQDIATLTAKPGSMAPALLAEKLAFLQWLAEGSFTFLGHMQLQTKAGQTGVLQAVSGTGLGLFKDAAWLKAACEADGMACGKTVAGKAAVLIAKSNLEATVHRGGQLDVIAVRQFHNGEVVGESRYVGLYTSSAYHDSVQRIPLLRHKVAEVIARSGYSLKGHDGKTLLNVLDTFPRDELFQIEVDELFTTSIRMMQAMERQRVRLFVRKEPAGRYYYCMVFVPKEVYSTELCIKIQTLLQQEFAGQSAAFTPHFLEAPLCRVDYLVRRPEKVQADAVDLVALEQAVALLAKNWPDQLKQALLATYGEQQGAGLYFKYHRAFAAGYREDYMGQQVVTDINHIERVQTDPHGLSLYFYQGAVAEANEARLKVFRLGGGLALTTVLPILENMGLKVLEERPYQVAVDAKQSVWISDFKLQLQGPLDQERIEPIFKEAFMRIWLGQAESDGFNRLIVMSGLSWREVLILRAIAKYWLQIGCRYSQSYIENALTDNPELARLLIQLFEVRFNPATGAEIGTRKAQADAVIAQLQTKLQSVSNLDQDRIINGYLSIIAAILRTNYFQLDANNQAKEYLSFKIESARIPNLPKPVPMFEVFVFSRAVEAIHLRMAKVARGGLRWSDRLEDFRTEVLGLMKAQQVKNAVIVPMGAKGGFVVKNPMPGASRDEILQNGIACYRTFIRGLLDITDNVYAGKVVAPVQVVRYDEDDIYLVVAADKGTATFSDIANEVASEYRFWLGDAFASGGRFGYDHKKMAITARGAWEAVKRSFLSFGHNTQTQPFTVVGIGDMSGDVFGNGMLLSEQIRLVGAFNHMHIFIDPNPDAAVSFQERQRLFNLPRSTWKDYNAELLSAGGGIYERQAKWITLSPEAKQRFGIDKDKVEPNELIQALLRAEVDLLWNGGIGTYIKASTETHFDVGDRQNDGLRIDATEVRAKVVGEGGNLGVTQRGRIEFALRGGLINTDAIDNSAGVDCSDHEVNIKILLNDLLAAKKLTVEERNQLLSEMVDDVAHLVLKNNYDQTQTIVNGLIDDSGSDSIFNRLIGELVREAGLDRKVEGIPSDRDLEVRRVSGLGLTAPELAVLMAYSKAIIRRTILSSTLPEDPYFFKYLAAEFPPVLADRYPEAMKQHRLARDIIATQVTNVMVKYMGVGFVHRMYDQTGATTQMIVRAFEVMSQLFCVPAIWRHIEKLDGKVPAKVQYELMHIVRRSIRRFSRWLLRHSRENCDVQTYLAILSPTLTRLRALQSHVLPERILTARAQAVEKYYQQGVPKALAQQVVNLDAISPVFDIIEVALNQAIDIEKVALMYAQVGERLSLGWLRTSLIEYSGKDDYWEMLTGSALRDDLDQYQSILTRSILVSTPDTIGAAERVSLWSAQHRVLVERWKFLFEDFRASKPDLLKLTIALRALADLVDTVRLRQGLTAYPRLNAQGEGKKGA